MTTKNPHEKSNDVKWNQKRRSLVTNENRPIPGITKKLEARFYPDYSYEAATYGPTTKVPHGIRKLRGGKSVGKETDNGVAHSIRLIRAYQFEPEVFWIRKVYNAAMKRTTLLKTHREKLTSLFKRNTTKTKRFVPYIRFFWETMRKLKLIPMDTQVEVRHKTVNISSMVDVVAIGAGRKHHCIEIKTGYDTYYHKHTPFKMKYPFTDKDDSPHNQHQLQAAATNEMYNHTFPHVTKGDPLILLLQSTGAKVITIQPWTNPSEMFNVLGKKK